MKDIIFLIVVELMIGKKFCHESGNIKNPNGDLDRYIFGAFTFEQQNSNGEVFIDDISIYRINDLLKIVINNDRNEIYDNINIVYKIDTTRETIH